MKKLQRFVLVPAVLAMLMLAASAAFADPPSRAVRLKYTSGEVSMQPGGVNDWVAAVLNRPLTSADRVWTDKNARAELSLGSGSLRMNSETSMTFTNVSDEIVQVELDQGTLNLHVRKLFDGETYEIDTPNLAFTILKAGDYRFDVDPNADTTYVTVWKGEGEANGQGNGVKLRSGDQASFANGTSLQHQTYNAPGRDGFDDWCKVRTDREDHADSFRYVSADVIGAEDLDEYGAWQPAGTYGTVWVPRVAPGWAPYRYGHWVWVEPWGWTWVDDAPWGFAPCHYGRWVYYRGFWGWSPGPVVVARPVYAPALVAWVGGPHVGVSITVGGGPGVGWFPLSWGEPYVPAYHVSRNYFQQVNVTNTHITNITNVTNVYYVNNNRTTVVNNTNVTNIRYANQRVPGAFTAVPNRVMTNSEPVGRNMVAVNGNEWKTAQVGAAPSVAPVRNSVLGTNAATRAAVPPMQTVPRNVVSHVAPPQRPIPFEAKQEALDRNPGRPLDAQTEQHIRSTIPATPVRAGGQPAQPGQPGTPVQPGRPGAPNGINAERPAPVAGSAPSTTPRPGMNQPGRNPNEPERTTNQPANTNQSPNANQPVNTNQPGMNAGQPGRAVPRPPQPGQGMENNPRAMEGPETGNPHVPATTQAPVTNSAPASTAAPVHNVPRPPQPGGSFGNIERNNNVDRNVELPRQPVRSPDAGSSPPANPPRSSIPASGNSVNSERTSPAPRSPENAPTSQPSPRPMPSPAPGNSGNNDHSNAAPRVQQGPSTQREPARINNVRSDSAPRISSNPRPQAPRPMYDSRTVHEEQKPQAKSQPAKESGHSEHKENR